MKLSIYPNYNIKQKCHYCGKRDASAHSCYKTTWSGLTKVVELFSPPKYETVKVEIPRCRECEKRHYYFSIPYIATVALCMSLCLFLVIPALIPSWSEGVLGKLWVAGLIMAFAYFVSSLLALIVQMIISGICKAILGKRLGKTTWDVSGYPPIDRLTECGFTTYKPDNRSIKGSTMLDVDKYRKAIHDLSLDKTIIIEKK